MPKAAFQPTTRDQGLPYCSEKQAAVFWYLLTDKQFFESSLPMIEWNWFGNPLLGKLWKFLVAFYRENKNTLPTPEELAQYRMVLAEPSADHRDALRNAMANAKVRSASFSLSGLEVEITEWLHAIAIRDALDKSLMAFRAGNLSGALQALKERIEFVETTKFGSSISPVRSLASIETKPLNWITPGWVHHGALHVIAGRKATGKSTVLLDAMCCWSSGRGWLGGRPRPPANCLILAAEDDQGAIIKPKVLAAGGDPDRIFVQDPNEWAMPKFPEDVSKLEEIIVANDIQYVHIDAVLDCLGHLDSHKDQDVRKALSPLRAMAERLGVTVFMVVHRNKNKGGDSVTSVMGSTAITAVARIVMIMAANPDSPGSFVMTRSNSNLGAPPKSRLYSLNASSPDSVDPCVVWGGTTDLTAEDIVNPAPGPSVSRGDRAVTFLAALLGDGSAIDKKDVVAKGALENLSEDSLERAAKKLNVISSPKPGGATEGRQWRLPTKKAIEEGLGGPGAFVTGAAA